MGLRVFVVLAAIAMCAAAPSDRESIIYTNKYTNTYRYTYISHILNVTNNKYMHKRIRVRHLTLDFLKSLLYRLIGNIQLFLLCLNENV